jgi:hypothetical protein
VVRAPQSSHVAGDVVSRDGPGWPGPLRIEIKNPVILSGARILLREVPPPLRMTRG